MILMFSGNESTTKEYPCTPEIVLADKDPGIMLSYFFMHTGNEKESKHHIYKRFKRHYDRKVCK